MHHPYTTSMEQTRSVALLLNKAAICPAAAQNQRPTELAKLANEYDQGEEESHT